ncbi:MAG: GDP-mannose 4,6-dehydratase [Planctomycetota bacterium]|nr:GDP-mannose 4,6-dehydratase [Planctomycetota bacterium]MDA1106442.1 GDP-mannose 4,6-dehydratase [Planctomycetota bacterium]
MRVLVTGGAGFIGSHLSEWLHARGDVVTILDDLSTGRRDNLSAIDGCRGVTFVEGSILDEPMVARLIDDADAVCHYAAAVGVKKIMDEPVATIHTNVDGTAIVLRHAARRRCRTILASTSEVYGKLMNVETAPLREDSDWRLGPTSVRRWAYAATKAVDEFLALALHAEQGLPITIVRHFNTVGPRQRGRYGMVLPRFARAALLGTPLEVHGDGQQTRCFCHVQDAVRAIAELLSCQKSIGHVVNVGTDQEASILELANCVRVEAKSASPITLVPYHSAYAEGFEDMARRTPDLSKLESLLGWRPETQLAAIVCDVLEDQRQRLARVGHQGDDD